MLTLCLVPWYLVPGLPRPAISQGVYSTLVDPLESGNEATIRVREARRLERRFVGEDEVR